MTPEILAALEAGKARKAPGRAGDAPARRRAAPAARPVRARRTERRGRAGAAVDDESGTVKIDGTDWFLHAHNPPLRLDRGRRGAHRPGAGAVRHAVRLRRHRGGSAPLVRLGRALPECRRSPPPGRTRRWTSCKPDTRTAVVTLTHDPKLDDPALDRALKSPAFYIGSLGSRRTHAARLKRLRELGHGEAALARIQGPGRPEHRGGDRAGNRAVHHRRDRRRAPRRAVAAEAATGGMKFGPVPLDEARGAIMAHSQRVGERMIRKGSVLDEAALSSRCARPAATEVIVARLEPGDVPEDIAADRLAQPLVSPLLARTRAATGRVNLAAEVPGLLRVDTAMINRLNTIDESLTIGTLPDYAVVAPKDLVATVKIIPFSVPGNVLARGRGAGPAERLAADAASVPPSEGRPRRHRAARPEGQRHREDHRRDRTAGDPAHRLAAAAGACTRTRKHRSARRWNR